MTGGVFRLGWMRGAGYPLETINATRGQAALLPEDDIERDR